MSTRTVRWLVIVAAIAGISAALSCMPRAGSSETQPDIAQRTVGVSGRIQSAETNEAKEGTLFAEKFISAFADRDFRKMYDMISPASLDHHHGNVPGSMRWYAGWRDIGVEQECKVGKNLNAKQINRSTQVIGGVTSFQAIFYLTCVAQDEKVLNRLNDGEWPAKLMFLRMRIGSRDSLLGLVKDNTHSGWSAMNLPGTMDIRSLQQMGSEHN